MARPTYVHTRCTRSGTTAVIKFDQATRIRLAFLRRAISTELDQPSNNSALVRLAVALLVQEVERVTEEPAGSIARYQFDHALRRARDSESLPFGEEFVLARDESLSVLLKQHRGSKLARITGKGSVEHGTV